MPVETSRFSETSFSCMVSNQLVCCRIGMFSPWLEKLHDWSSIAHYHCSGTSARQFIEDLIQQYYGLELDMAQAVTSSYGAPFMPTQKVEKKFPIDTAMNCNGIFYFLQFKVSKCVTGDHWKLLEFTEIDNQLIDTPLYRVDFDGCSTSVYDQYLTLYDLELDLISFGSALVRYVTPSFHKLSEFSQVQNRGLSATIDGRWPIVCFKPSAFSIPDGELNHVSYDGKKGNGWYYSSEAKEIPSVASLSEEINRIALTAPPLSDSIAELRKKLESFNVDDDIPLIFSSESEESQNRKLINFLGATSSNEISEPYLAEAFRRIIAGDDDEETFNSRIAFIDDFTAADYHCRRIFGNPLLVGLPVKSEIPPPS